jgi:DNA-binding transcriptional MerR regulator
MNSMMSISEVSTATGVARHRIVYAIKTNRIPKPMHVLNRRAFTSADVQRIRDYFREQRR